MSQAAETLTDDAQPSAPEEAGRTGAAKPAGFESTGGDLVGYWEALSPPDKRDWKKDKNCEWKSPGSPPVLFTPLHVTLSDSKIEPGENEQHKSSTLLHCRLEEPCELRSATEGEGYRVFPKGSLFGIWTKPGMRELQNLAGKVVWMSNDTVKDTGRPSLMAIFDISHDPNVDGKKLTVAEDRRKHSLPAAVRERRAAAQKAAAEAGEGEDFIPF